MPKHIDTRLLHAGTPPFHDKTAPVNTPVVRTSTVRFESTAAYEEIYRRRAKGEALPTYGRQGMATHRALEEAIALLEGGSDALLTPSGLAAISLTFLALLAPGDHVLVADNVYAPVRRLHKDLLQRLGISFTYFSAGKDDLEALIAPNTKMIYAESPGSLLYEILDMPRISAIAKRHGLIVATDNTWGSGYLYRPLALGADVSIIASTKYISGHSDVMQGAVVVNDAALAKKIYAAHESIGLSISADDAYLALRGVRTMPVRLAQHQRNALQVAQFLEQHPMVRKVFHPALPSDAGHAVWLRDFDGANGLVSFEFGRPGVGAARAFVDALQFFSLGASWGGYESLVQIIEPARLAEQSYWNGANPAVRLHVGLESAPDLIEDLAQAFKAFEAFESKEQQQQ
ncbi:cystathionine beta-lyase [Oxalobacteraceae bacterium CAVE-383]|nr:cystathionine beta-lyase [Oxalobacteraceae bacterium CAVE-383]